LSCRRNFLKEKLDKAAFDGYNKLCDDRGGSMTLELKRIFANSGAVMSIEHELDMSDVDHAGGFPLKKPVRISGSVTNKADVIELHLDMSYDYSGLCDRCGAEVTRRYDISLNKALALSIEGEESDTILTVPEMQLDVDELVFTEVYMSLPTKFLCKSDCAGLCVKCGKNLNDGACNCSQKEIDPRLAKLADLLNQ